MTKITLKPPQARYPEDIEDVKRIVEVCSKNGYDISPETAYVVWKEYSEAYCASWIVLTESEDNLLSIVLCSPIVEVRK